MKKIDRTGEVINNTRGIPMKIIEYKNANEIIVEFQDEYKAKIIGNYRNFKKGLIKNPYDKIIFDIGYIGVGEYKSRIEGDATICYRIWRDMLERCYNPYYLNKYPTYINCFVCEEWHCFQNFAEWFYKRYYEIPNERMCLDKDILIKNNKLYSPSTCCIVPEKINLLFVKNDISRGDLPIGVTFYKNKYTSQCSCNHKQNYLGRFNDIRSAWLMYKINKELVIQSIANEYKDKIPQYVYEAMMNYRVEYDD